MVIATNSIKLFTKKVSVVESNKTEQDGCETDVARIIRLLIGFVVLDIFG